MFFNAREMETGRDIVANTYLTKSEKNGILETKKDDFVIKCVISHKFHDFLP